MKINKLILLLPLLAIICGSFSKTIDKPRVIISTDIGGSDPDDYQSMVHFLVYADRFDIEGLISSPPNAGRKEHIDEVIFAYKKDYSKLKKYSRSFPRPSDLLKVTKQGAINVQNGDKPEDLSEGAKWIIKMAKKKDKRPLYIQVWGSMTDVAQAVHHDPSIKNKIRVYYIGSWNTDQDEKSRDYLYNHHPDLWWIENNTTFRGMYLGGIQDGEWNNVAFVEKYVKGHGAMGELFWEKKKDIKMGDTPAVLYFLHGDPNNPEGESWGGSFVKTGHGAHYWTDNPDPTFIENNRPGAKTVNKHRKAFLEDWAKRMKWIMNSN